MLSQRIPLPAVLISCLLVVSIVFLYVEVRAGLDRGGFLNPNFFSSFGLVVIKSNPCAFDCYVYTYIYRMPLKENMIAIIQRLDLCMYDTVRTSSNSR